MPIALMIELAAGSALGALMLAAYRKSSARSLMMNGNLVLAVMLGIYVGAHLVASDTQRIVMEFGVFAVWVAVARLTMRRWPPAIGVAIFAHGIYDIVFGPAVGVAAWYPAACLGFDVVVGTGLFLRLRSST